MKKLAILIVLMVYAAASFGMSVHFHYCCGKLKDVNIIAAAKSCGMDHNMGSLPCCDDKQVSLKIKSDQQATKTIYPSLQVFTPQVPIQGYSHTTERLIQKNFISEVFAPPPPNNFILDLFCTYLI